MADKQEKLSIEQILAACRQADSGSGAPSVGKKPDGTKAGDTAAPIAGGDASSASGESQVEAAPTAKVARDMSVDDVLAAARGAKPAGEAPQVPAAKPAASGRPPGAMSIEEILAAARSSKGGAPAEAPAKAAPKPPAAPKPAAEKPAAVAKPAAPAAKNTSSVLAAARQAVRPGPISKAEAAASGAAARPAPAAARTAAVVPPMPARPAYAKPQPKPAGEPGESRRGFLGLVCGSFLAVGFTSLTLTNVLWTLGLARFMFPNILIEPPSQFRVGFPADFAPGMVETKFTAQFGVWIVNYQYDGQSQIFALRTVCTHLGCTPNWLEAEQRFKCPCHGSGFYKDGINFEGPAPRPLERYAIRIAEDGQLEVDKSRLFQEELGQWRDPASFVPV
jgi:cytochrome b6-f complex iron-sulfur subunit